MKDFRKTRFNYSDVRDAPMKALQMLLDLPPKPDAMTEPVAFNNVKVARQRMRNYLDEMKLEKAEFNHKYAVGKDYAPPYGDGVVGDGSIAIGDEQLSDDDYIENGAPF